MSQYAQPRKGRFVYEEVTAPGHHAGSYRHEVTCAHSPQLLDDIPPKRSMV